MVCCQGQIETENGSFQTLWTPTAAPPPPPPPPHTHTHTHTKKSYSPKLNKEKIKLLSDKHLK